MAKCSIKIDTVEKVVKQDVKKYTLELDWDELRFLYIYLITGDYISGLGSVTDAIKPVVELEES